MHFTVHSAWTQISNASGGSQSNHGCLLASRMWISNCFAHSDRGEPLKTEFAYSSEQLRRGEFGTKSISGRRLLKINLSFLIYPWCFQKAFCPALYTEITVCSKCMCFSVQICCGCDLLCIGSLNTANNLNCEPILLIVLTGLPNSHSNLSVPCLQFF